MSKMMESCSVCGRSFDVQFRYQMEESKGGFLFFCSQDCQGRHVRGEATSGVSCDACGKHFAVELVSQVVRTKDGRGYACSEDCRTQILREADGARLSDLVQKPSAVPPAPVSASDVLRTPVPAAIAPVAAIAPAPASTPRAKVDYRGPKRLAIFNHKGGTGKTTTTVSIAAGLAERGLRVLVVDTDSQGNVSVSLGVKGDKSLYHVLVMGIRPEDVAEKVRDNFDLISSNETLAAAELYLAGRQNRDRILRDRLAKFSDSYDVVIIDCSPSLSLMNQNALVMADALLVPVACDFLSLVGVRQVLRTVKNVNSLLHHPVQIFGVLPTFYDARARICRDAVETLTEHFGDRCLQPIRSATKIKEAPAQGRTIFEYAPESNAAEDYMRIVDRIIAGNVAETTTTEQARRSA